MKRSIVTGFMVLLSTCTFAQIQGDITDANDNGISDAVITVNDSLRNFTYSVKSNTMGFYSFNSLKPGEYKIEVKAFGFKSIMLRNIIVNEGEMGFVRGDDLYNGQRLDITLTPLKSP